jgi:hypothetical protein
MRIHLGRTGGFGGLGQTAAVDDSTLADDEREELRRLVEHADPWSLPDDVPGPAPAPDRFRYRLTVEDGERRREIRVREEALPETLRPLVRWMEDRIG